MSKKITTEEFIEKAKEIHGDRYDYSKVSYVNAKTKVCIICPEHGEFFQTPNSHLNGRGCFKCAFLFYDRDSFIERAIEFHGDKYDYSKVKYINNLEKVCIVCPEHGEFWQSPSNHINNKQDCPKCAIVKTWNKRGRITTENFINKVKLLHGDKYDYSKVEYKNCDSKVCIICSKHGEFWQTPDNHIQGHGCPFCNESKLECYINSLLENMNIKYERQKKFEWLKYKYPLSLDFYLPEYNIAIECQGQQHFEPIEHFGGENELLKTSIRDKLKNKLCYNNGIQVKYINFFESKNEIKEKIKNLL